MCYRHNITGKFEKIQMSDDGEHNDGAAGDGVFGATINIGSGSIQYYIYAENSSAGIFSPERAEYEYYTLPVAGELVINEFMASNDETVADQDSEFNDWIELYNNSNESISLGGYHLSDDADNLSRWTFPDTLIDGNGYLIIWADGDTSQSGLHANFKLSASGEAVYLVDTSLNIVDMITFLTQTTDISTGRFPNGTGSFIAMYPTFSAENENTLGISQVSPGFKVNIYPNPSDNWVMIEMYDQNIHELKIFDVMGRSVFQGIINDKKRLDISRWNPGLYIIRIGDTTIRKLIVE